MSGPSWGKECEWPASHSQPAEKGMLAPPRVDAFLGTRSWWKQGRERCLVKKHMFLPRTLPQLCRVWCEFECECTEWELIHTCAKLCVVCCPFFRVVLKINEQRWTASPQQISERCLFWKVNDGYNVAEMDQSVLLCLLRSHVPNLPLAGSGWVFGGGNKRARETCARFSTLPQELWTLLSIGGDNLLFC